MSLMDCVFILLFNLIAFTNTTELRSILEISALNKINNSFVRNEQELLVKLNKLIVGGSDALQIVTDYDLTLTADPVDSGKRVLNSFEMFRLCPAVPQNYKDSETELFNNYHNIEVNPDISDKEKNKAMLEWHTASRKSLRGIKYPREEMKSIAQEISNSFREGIHDLVSWCDNHNVPMLVLSSGLGDAVLVSLEVANLKKSTVKVISNFIEVDNNDIIIGMKGEPIHSYNKNDTLIKHSNYHDTIKQRTNVILMGDVLGDAHMIDGIDNLNAVIKIGFLGSNKRKYLETYLKHFDIVLINDQTMDVINGIINHIA